MDQSLSSLIGQIGMVLAVSVFGRFGDFQMPLPMFISHTWTILKQSVSDWIDDKAPKMAAALAYYTAISLAPLIIITIKIVAVIKGSDWASWQLHQQLVELTDPSVANALQDTIHKAGQPGSGRLATLISVVIALFGASGVFAELQDSIDTIWKVKPKPNRGIMGLVRDRFLSVTMVLGIAFLLLVSMFVSAIVTAVSGAFIQATVGAQGSSAKVIAMTLEIVLSTGVVTVLFAAIFRLLPDVMIAWKDVWLGSFVTSVLFELGKIGLSIYLVKGSPTSAYGAAGSMVAVLLWVYYSAQILYFGAEFTQVYANRFGSHILPAQNAEPLHAQAKVA